MTAECLKLCLRNLSEQGGIRLVFWSYNCPLRAYGEVVEDFEICIVVEMITLVPASSLDPESRPSCSRMPVDHEIVQRGAFFFRL